MGLTLTDQDLSREPKLVGLAVDLEGRRHLRTEPFMSVIPHRWALGGKEYIGEPCVFLDKNDCTIYESRPEICRTYSCKVELR